MELRSSIKILPEHLIDQIKAGEVIEGPASLVKELLENAIDAHSTVIKIQVENNGLDLISVEDNGIGMTMEELPLAFCRHATSKISRFEDLYSLGTFGFRGEALASIASISRVTAFSKPVEGTGGKLIYHGGKLISHLPMENLEQGTSIIVRDLFFNTPVRFKFIKSKISEKNSITKNINSFIISNPNIYFSVKWDDNDRSIFKQNSWSERILQVLPKGDYREIKGEYEGYLIKGFIGINSSKGSIKNHQYLFANNRLFMDKSIHAAITKSMEGVWQLGETGTYCIFLTTNPANIDVNVHPRKTEIKFLQSSLVFSLFQSAIKNSVCDIKKSSPKTPMGLNDFLEKNLRDNLNNEKLEPNPIFKVSEDFIIYPQENHYLLINYPSLFISYLKNNFKPVPESSQIPLLIGEPYGLEVEDIRFFLKKYGFNFEKIDNEKMILLTIPSYLQELPFRKIAGMLIKCISEKGRKNDFFFVEDFQIKEIKISFSQIKFLINSFKGNLKNKDFVKVLDNDLLKSLFNQI